MFLLLLSKMLESHVCMSLYKNIYYYILYIYIHIRPCCLNSCHSFVSMDSGNDHRPRYTTGVDKACHTNSNHIGIHNHELDRTKAWCPQKIRCAWSALRKCVQLPVTKWKKLIKHPSTHLLIPRKWFQPGSWVKRVPIGQIIDTSYVFVAKFQHVPLQSFTSPAPHHGQYLFERDKKLQCYRQRKKAAQKNAFGVGLFPSGGGFSAKGAAVLDDNATMEPLKQMR